MDHRVAAARADGDARPREASRGRTPAALGAAAQHLPSLYLAVQHGGPRGVHRFRNSHALEPFAMPMIDGTSRIRPHMHTSCTSVWRLGLSSGACAASLRHPITIAARIGADRQPHLQVGGSISFTLPSGVHLSPRARLRRCSSARAGRSYPGQFAGSTLNWQCTGTVAPSARGDRSSRCRYAGRRRSSSSHAGRAGSRHGGSHTTFVVRLLPAVAPTVSLGPFTSPIVASRAAAEFQSSSVLRRARSRRRSQVVRKVRGRPVRECGQPNVVAGSRGRNSGSRCRCRRRRPAAITR